MARIGPKTRELAGELNPGDLVRSLSTGALLYVLEVITILSFTALIFSGPLASAAPYGLGLLLAGDALLCAFVALLSSFRGTIAVSQDAPSAILALTAASVSAASPPSASPGEGLATVVVMIAGATLVTGLFFLLLGAFRLGGLVRYLPYPVVGGFLAGTGWLLLSGAVGVMAGPSLPWELFQPANLLRWLPGLVLGLALLYGTLRWPSPLVLPGIFVTGIILFYLAAWLLGVSPARLLAGGFLMGPFSSGSQWHFPLTPQTFQEANWGVLGANLGRLAPLPIISVIALLLNATGLELISRKDFNLNRELVVAGSANLLAGLAGGLAGYHAISLSSLNLAATGGKRLPGVVAALLLGLTIFASAALLAYLPRMALGSLLAFLGLSLLYEWVFQAWSRFPKIDFAILVLILVTIAVEGFLVGILLGLVLAVILFVVSYSRVSVVKHTLSGASYRSRVNRSLQEEAVLALQGDGIYILALQGFIFFGTANGLFEQVRERTRQADRPGVRAVLLAFERVSGLDSTSLLSFRKLLQLAQEQSFSLALAGLSTRLKTQFIQAGLDRQPVALNFFPDLDRALEWCENQLLAGAVEEGPGGNELIQALLAIYPHPQPVKRLLEAMQYRTLAPGEYLFQQGQASDCLALVASGQVTAQLESPGREAVRLETMGRGRVVGELGFYLGTPRSAAVIAVGESHVYLLERQVLERLEREDSEAALALHRIIIHLLGERVRHLMRAVEALQP